jgi:hypothetical protein
MAFDLATAKPVASGKFDLSTAKPVSDTGRELSSSSAGYVVEPMLTGATGAIGQLTGGAIEIAGRQLGMIPPGDYGGTTRRIQQSMTYEPRTVEGERANKALGAVLGPTVGAVVKGTGDALAWAAKNAGIEEGGQEVARQAPEAALNAFGLVTGAKGIKKGYQAGKVAAREGVKIGSEAIKAADHAVQVAKGTPYINIIDDAGRIDPLVVDNYAKVRSTDIKSPLAVHKDALPKPALDAHNKIVQATGVPSMKGQITGKADDTSQFIDLLKESNDVSRQWAAQNEGLANNLATTVDDFKPSAINKEQANSVARDVLHSTMSEADNLVTQAYTAAKEMAPVEKNIQPSNYVDLLKKKSRMIVGDPTLAKSLYAQLEDIGVINPKMKGLGKVDIKTAEGIRQNLNAASKSTSDYGRSIIRELKDALDDDVAAGSGMPELFESARAAKVKAASLRKKQGIDKYDEYGKSKSLVNDILTNKIPEEKIIDKIANARNDDFAKLHEFYTKDAGPSGAQAWNDIGANFLKDAIDKSLIKNQEGGTLGVNIYKLKKELSPVIDNSKKAELMFGDKVPKIKSMIEAGELLTPKRAYTGMGSGPSGLAIKSLEASLKKLADQAVVDVVTAGVKGAANQSAIKNQVGHIDRYANLVQKNRKQLQNANKKK